MAEYRLMQKQLAGKEDLLLGVGSVSQRRASGVKDITKINSTHLGGILVIDTLAELSTLDVTKLGVFPTVFVKSNKNFYTYNGTMFVSSGTNFLIKDNIEELKTVDTNIIDTVEVLGYYTSGDGGGGTFYWDSTSTETDNGGTIIQTTGVTTGRWKRVFSGAVNVKWFGAKGDGIVDDTDAFKNASALITANSGGKLVIPKGTYIVGKQTFAGATGKGYAYLPSDIIKITNCIDPVIIEGEGAILKATSGLKFGSFDPVTGAVYNPIMPFTNYDYIAQAYFGMIFIDNNKSVSIKNLDLDGNIANTSLGGTWGDTGRQCAAYGIQSSRNDKLTIENVYTHHHALDGLLIGYSGLTELSDEKSNTLINVVSEYNARQGFSWTGGTNLTAISCKFNHTGKSTFSSSPSAGVDVEAESSICRNGIFINCEFSDNAGIGFLASTGDISDIKLERCKFIGQNNYAIWANKPRIVFDSCFIIGVYVNSYASTTKDDATKFIFCKFTDELIYASTLYNIGTLGNILSATATQTNVQYNSCSFTATRAKVGRLDGAILNNCSINITAGTAYCGNQDWHITLWNSTVIDTNITTNITTGVPTDAFYVNLGFTNFRGVNNLTNLGTGLLRWRSWSVGAGGFVGYHSESNSELNPIPFVCVNRAMRDDNYYGVNKIYFSNAAPTSGTYNRGDKVFNQDPSVGSPKGWVCTVTGTPGTWVSEGNL